MLQVVLSPKREASSLGEDSETMLVTLSSTAKLDPIRGFFSSMLLMAETSAIMAKINEMRLSTTEPIIKPTADASIVFPKPMGLVSF